MSDLSDRLGQLFKGRPWHKRPRLLAMLELIDIRDDLRQKNLHDTEEPPLEQQDVPPDPGPTARDARTIDGTYNDLQVPRMGAAGCRFGRNVPLAQTFPDTPNLLVPNPRQVSRELMTREQFQPATMLNLLAASWIQFMVHDWFVHDRSKTDHILIPTGADDTWGAPHIQVPRSIPDKAPAGSTRPPGLQIMGTQKRHRLDPGS